MTDCETKFVQMNKKFMMLRCENQCTKEHYVRFNHKDLQQKVTQLKSSTAVGLVQEGFEDFFDEDTKTHSVALLQADSAGFQDIAETSDDAAEPVQFHASMDRRRRRRRKDD